MKRATIFILSLAITSLLIATPAAAGSKNIELAPPSGPQSFPSWGMASIHTRGKVQRFTVRADAGLADGATVVISIEVADHPNPSRWVDVAKAEIRLGTALIVLNSEQDVSPVFPVNNVLAVRATYKGKTFLQGSFTDY